MSCEPKYQGEHLGNYRNILRCDHEHIVGDCEVVSDPIVNGIIVEHQSIPNASQEQGNRKKYGRHQEVAAELIVKAFEMGSKLSCHKNACD